MEGGGSVADAPRFDDPGALSGVLAGVSFVGGLATGLRLADAPFPRPGADVKDIQRFFLGNAGPERINLTGQLISAAPPRCGLERFPVIGHRLDGVPPIHHKIKLDNPLTVAPPR
jgi:hypothetical protein